MSRLKDVRIIALFFLLMMLGMSCDTGRSPVYIFLDDLKGMWKLENLEIYEKWSELKDNQYFATVYKIDGERTSVIQNLRIVDQNEEISLEVRVFSQNEGAPSRFLLIEQSKTKVLFRNEVNDFPKDIQYEFVTDDTLKVTMAGMVNDSYKKMFFKYYRLPPPEDTKSN